MKLLRLLSTSAVLLVLLSPQAILADDISDEPAPKSNVTELKKIDTVVGSGKAAFPGLDAVVHYTGWIYNPAKPEGHGKKFDSSVDRGEPFDFPLGAGRVIRGWDEGVAGMKVGGKRTLIIPPHMGYGPRGAGGVIPPNATLIFDVELVGLRQPGSNKGFFD